jgi:hypothetical protein
MAFLNLNVSIVGYEDTPPTSAPLLQDVDWTRPLRGVSVTAPGRVPVAPIPAGGSITVLNGTRTLTVDGTTAFTVTLDPLDATQYFLTWTAGTTPGFRADRGLTLNGDTLSVTPQANGSVLFSITNLVLGSFAGVNVGDNVWIPGVSTGDPSGPFNPINEGLWVVLSTVDSQNVILVRPPGSTLGYLAQTGVVITANIQLQAFSAAGVQVGDQVDISLGATLPSPLINTFDVTGVTGQRLQIRSTNPLPVPSTITPTAAGIVVYSQAYNFIYLEADQDCAVQANGDTSMNQRMSPWVPGGACSLAPGALGKPGQYMKTGPTWELTIVNRSVNTLNVVLIVAQ